MDLLYIVTEGSIICQLPQEKILDAVLGLLGSFYIYNVLGGGSHLSLFPPFSMTWQMPESVRVEPLFFKNRKY